MMKKLVSIGCLALLLSACAGENAPQVQAMQKKDKQLSCKEALLEMNEAQFYMKMAQKNKGPNLKNILMPLGYISTYMNAEEAINAASARVDYLNKVYDIMNCENGGGGGPSQGVSYQQPYASPPPVQYMGTAYPSPNQGGGQSYIRPAQPQQQPAYNAPSDNGGNGQQPGQNRFW